MLEGEFDVDDFLDLGQKPRINLGQLMDLIKGETLGKCVTHVPNPLRTRLAEFDLNFFTISGLLIQTIDADLEAT